MADEQVTYGPNKSPITKILHSVIASWGGSIYQGCCAICVILEKILEDHINLWGLIETLRPDFNNHFMVLSTHETDYGKLLEYKLKKWGVDTEYVEMSLLHNKQ